MILEVDAGNTRVKWRIVDHSGCIVCRGAGVQFDKDSLQSCAGVRPLRARICSVRNSEWNRQIRALIQQEWAIDPEFAAAEAELEGLVNGYHLPERLGTDRWLAMLAGRKRWPHEALIVVDCGSAATFDFISRDGLHLGGYIVPGVRLQLEGLSSGTTLSDFGKPDWHDFSPGRDTKGAVRKGVARMLSAWVIEEARSCFGGAARVLITGGDGLGLSESLQRYGLDHEFLDDLVLDGLQIALP